MDKFDIHNRQRRLELAINSVKSMPASQNNKEAILNFCNYCSAEGLSLDRIEHYARILKKISELFAKDFVDAEKQDIVELVLRIDSRKLSSWTKHDYRVALKKFYRWLRNATEYPEEVVWIKTGFPRSSSKLPEQLLTEDDVDKLIRTCSDAQMKALISMRWETGSRIAELLNLRIENVEPTDKYAAMIVNGKTGMRRVVIIFAWPYLMQWLNMHPKKDDPSAPVWIQRNGGPLSYPDVRKRLQILAKKAKVKKPVNPHMFRHSRATFLAQHLTESQLSQYFGWIQGSRMPATYVYMSGKDLIPHLLKLNGLEEENLTGAT